LAEPREVALGRVVDEGRDGVLEEVVRERDPLEERPPVLEPEAMPLRYAVTRLLGRIADEC
jgi:hypothetical protein